MKIVLAGSCPETAKKAIKECFPDDWEIRIVSPEAVEGELADGVRFHRKRFAFFADNIERFLNHETPECRLNEI